MGIKSFLGLEKKSAPEQNPEDPIAILRRVFGLNDGHIYHTTGLSHKLSPANAYLTWEKISVINDAVEKISKRVASLSVVVKDKSRNIVQHEIENLLKNPSGSSMTRTDFWDQIATSLLLTNESWIVARGNISRPPIEMDVIEPYDVDAVVKKQYECMPEVIKTNSSKDKRTYRRKIINGQERWVSDDELNELIPIIGKRYKGDWRGYSKLSPLVEEISHIKDGNIHNRSLLRNGLNASAVFSPEGHEVDVKDGEDLSEMLRRHHQGAGNTGKPLILPAPFKMLMKSGNNREMDYMLLIDTDETRVYRAFNIPLPIVKSSTMTQSNYEASIPFFYSEAILPAFDYIAEHLTMKLKDRFNLGDLRISYDEFDIPAMNNHQVKLMKDLKDTSAVKVNEIRQRGGYEPVEGGDEVLITTNQIPLKEGADFSDYTEEDES